MKNKFFYLCILVVFLSIPIIAKSKKKKIFKQLSIALMFMELDKFVKDRDKNLIYSPKVESHPNCQKTIVEYQDMPWDKNGLYPAPFQDIRVLCKPNKEKLIFVVGDSMTGGPGLQKENTYPFYLSKQFSDVTFVNAGINGSNTYHWRKGGILFDRIITQNKEQIDGIILLIGGNNILFTEHVLKQKAIPSIVVSEISNVIQDLQNELPNKPIYLGNYPVPHVMSEEMYAELEVLKNNTKNTISGPDFRTPFENKPEYFLKDFLHLNEKGHLKMGQIWESFFHKEGWK